MNFAQKAVAANGQRLFYMNAYTEKGSAWYFVLIKPGKLVLFESLDYSKAFTITDYGYIIKSGLGDRPAGDMVEEINKKYNTNFSVTA